MSMEPKSIGKYGVSNTDPAFLLSSMIQKGNKETRTSEALAMKDEQMRILGDQNTHLLNSLNVMDDEINTLKQQKLHLEEENQNLRDQNFEFQSKARSADSNLKRIQSSMEEKETQVKVLTDHNTELLRLLEHEESQSSTLSKEKNVLQVELETLQTRYASLLSTAKTHEEIASRATREVQLRAEEVRLLRNESDQLHACNAELKMKTQVELESLQEQLRVRKEKQYQLLEKIQHLEENKRQNDDQLIALEEKLRKFHEKNQELETQIQLETKAKRSQLDANKNFFIENANLLKDKQEIQLRFEKAEQERTRMEAENRDSAEQLREMAEKVFQLLERLKLAELGKTKAIDALKQKELEMISLKKKNSRLLKEGTQESKARVKTEMDKKILFEQIQALKKHNTQLSLRCSEEVKIKLKEQEEKKIFEEKIKTMSGRIAFLLNKMQADEEAKIITKEEIKKMHAQILSIQEKNTELTQKLYTTAESNRVLTEALRCKQDEIDAISIKMEALQKKITEMTIVVENSGGSNGILGFEENNHHTHHQELFTKDQQHPEDLANAQSGRFYVESRSSNGGLLLIKARRSQGPNGNVNAIEFLDKTGTNAFLKRAQKSMNTKQLLVERIAMLLTTMMMVEENIHDIQQQLAAKEEQIGHLSRKTMMMQEKLTLEEDAKRKTLLRYVHEIKAKSSTKGPNGEELSATILKLPESGIGDEEVHAIAALLRNNSTVKELQLRGNSITNEGARAVAAILSSAVCQIRLVDLRQNHIGKDGIKVLAEALERNERIKHVYVHAGGKIEALGTNTNGHLGATGSSSSTIATGAVIGVETICVVDVRENDVPTNSSFANADVDVGDELDASVVSLDGGFMLGSITKTSHGPMSKSSSNGVSSALKLKMTAEETLGGSTSSRLFSHRPMSSSTLEKQQKEKKLLRKKKQEEDKKNLKKEAEWNGRAGGIDNSANSPAVKKLPPIGVNNNTENSNNSTGSEGAKSVNRSSSAPVLKKEGEQIPATIDTTVDDAKAALDKAVSSSSLKKDKKQRQTESALMQKLRDSPLAKT